MSKSNNLSDLLKSVADAIRAKKETSVLINPQDFADEIGSIKVWGPCEITIHTDATSAVLTCGDQTYTLQEENEHTFYVTPGTYVCSVTYGGDTYTENVTVGYATSTQSIFVSFVDPEVERVLVAHGVGSSDGITKGQLAGVTNIGKWFQSNTVITEFPELRDTGLTALGQQAFTGCSNLVEINLPETVTSIGAQAFQNCSNLVEINLPETLTSIGGTAFGNCTKLVIDTIYLPNLSGTMNRWRDSSNKGINARHITSLGSVTSLSSGALSGWNLLEDVVLPETVTSIGQQAFYNCSNLVEINLKNPTPPSFGASALNGCSALTHIYVPADSVEAYKTASGWSSYANIISAIPTE